MLCSFNYTLEDDRNVTIKYEYQKGYETDAEVYSVIHETTEIISILDEVTLEKIEIYLMENIK